jgi:L-aspartate oxidase
MRIPSDVDVVVVGGGAAGMSAALEAARTRRVALVVKSPRLGDGATRWAQGGIAAALATGDRIEDHVEDTLSAGAGLCHRQTVQALVSVAPAVVRALEGLGARFDRTEDGALALGREGGHGADRVVHAGGDRTGAEISRALALAVRTSRVEVLEHTLVTDLLLDPAGRVAGVDLLDEAGVPGRLTARTVILATGGLGQVYGSTSNPPEATGDGIALALRAGATVGDAEFVQFHPTVLWTGGAGSGQQPLVTEALRGAGARLVDHAGHPVMRGVHPLADLAPRDVVAARLHEVISAGALPHVFLDASHLGARKLATQFPGFLEASAAIGVDPRSEPVPVAPGAHYSCGGVRASVDGTTEVEGLLAVGEVAWTGMHGGNRLASNSLLEALATGARAGRLVAARLPRPSKELTAAPTVPGLVDRAELQSQMSRAAGVVRDEQGLSVLVDTIGALAEEIPLRTTRDVENAHLRLAALAIARAALARRESRGSHRRTDHPRTDPAWRRPVLTRLRDGDLETRADRRELSA